MGWKPNKCVKILTRVQKACGFQRQTVEYEMGHELELLREITRNTNQHTQETSTPDEKISVGLS